MVCLRLIQMVFFNLEKKKHYFTISEGPVVTDCSSYFYRVMQIGA